MVNRNLETFLVESLGYFPAVGILGARQVGKTTLAKQIISKLNNQSVYFDLELMEDYLLLSSNATLILENHQDKTVIIDEIQRYLPLLPQLRGLIDRNRQAGRFILLGSASPQFLQKSSESLAGRIAYHELSPFLSNEVENLGISLQKLWFRGGFPDALLAPTDALAYQWQQNFIKTYVEQDLNLLGLTAPPPLLYNLLRMLSHTHGSLVNYSTLANSLGIKNNTVQKYISILEQAYLLRRLEPWYLNISKRLTKSPKLIFRDSGNLHFLHNIKSEIDLIQHPIAGASWEGFIIEQIIQRLKSDIQAYFYRTANGSEIDLVLVEGIKPIIAIEIKLSLMPTLKRGFTEAVEDLKTEHNFVVTPTGGNYLFRPNCTLCNLSELMSHFKKLNILR
jgi:uncharacterized protein